MNGPKNEPLLLDFRYRVKWLDHLVLIRHRGKALAERSPDGWWIYGVIPGAVADCGTNLRLAIRNFGRRIESVLVDYAGEAKDFDSFRSEAKQFLASCDADTWSEWEAAGGPSLVYFSNW